MDAGIYCMWNLLQGRDSRVEAGPRFKSGVVLEQEIKEANAECPQPSQKARELGAGLALPSICLSCIGHECIATDLPQAIPMLTANASANAVAIQQSGGRLAVLPLDLGDVSTAPDVVNHFDLVIASDICYDPVLYTPLLATLRSLSFRYFLIATRRRSVYLDRALPEEGPDFACNG
eukprot:s744_g36.t1